MDVVQPASCSSKLVICAVKFATPSSCIVPSEPDWGLYSERFIETARSVIKFVKLVMRFVDKGQLHASLQLPIYILFVGLITTPIK